MEKELPNIKCRHGEKGYEYNIDLDDYLDPCFSFLLKIRGKEDKLDWKAMVNDDVIPISLYGYVFENKWLTVKDLDTIELDVFEEIKDYVDYNDPELYDKVEDLNFLPFDKVNKKLYFNKYMELDEVMFKEQLEYFIKNYFDTGNKKHLSYIVSLLEYFSIHNRELYKDVLRWLKEKGYIIFITDYLLEYVDNTSKLYDLRLVLNDLDHKQYVNKLREFFRDYMEGSWYPIALENLLELLETKNEFWEVIRIKPMDYILRPSKTLFVKKYIQ
jgi:hypothetical protein